MADLEEIVNKAVQHVEGKTRELSDEAYLEVLEGVIDTLQMSVHAKKEEQG